MHPALVEGLSDAVGFGGGIVLVGLGGGAGLQLARYWRRKSKTD